MSNYSKSELWFNSQQESERKAIQTDLIWTGDYSQILDGLFGNSTFEAIKSFEERSGGVIDGVLPPWDRDQLSQLANSERQRVGFQKIYDEIAKLWIGLPTSLLMGPENNKDGKTWTSIDGRLTVITFSSDYDGGNFPNTYEAVAKRPEMREIKYQTFRPGFFIISSVNGLAKNYVRFHDLKDHVAGFLAVWRGDGDSDIRKLIVAISNSLEIDQEAQPNQVAKKETPQISPDDKIEVKSLPPPQKPFQTGTGFFVNNEGNLLTNAHVVAGCNDASLKLSDGRLSGATIVARDEKADLAILKSVVPGLASATFRQGPPLRVGADIELFGYPLIDIVTTTGNFAVGMVSALAGPGDDASIIQISAPVQSGNSGGAVLDRSGYVIGVVVAKTNMIPNGKEGEVVQQVNFAISGDVAKSYVTSIGLTISQATSSTEKNKADIADQAKSFSAIVVCQPQ